ncbi:hypothetical protein FH972_022206 [Carpinus fangiana]|uniref:F-box domain-containing protein n=1 Tax=Carpinus fangiana TaxID=176857 RepID=A0A5N6KS38_9ROSI|nr:hypothetical protein FH972_022206 [Carpinus fangiana]
MTKRKASESLLSDRVQKARKTGSDGLSDLSDELLLRILGNVSIHSLTCCQQVNRRLHDVAGDAQLWKAAYYERFVRPRASRLPGVLSQPLTPFYLSYSSKLSKWLSDSHLVNGDTDWKGQYRLRHNWSRGTCSISEIPVADGPSVAPVLARLRNGIVYTVDRRHGLRAFSCAEKYRLLTSEAIAAHTNNTQPTVLTVEHSVATGSVQRLAVGFEAGSFAIFCYCRSKVRFTRVYSHAASLDGDLTEMVLAWPYLSTISQAQTLSLYRFSSSEPGEGEEQMSAPVLLARMESHTVWPPLSLALRLIAGNVVLSVAYSKPTMSFGWLAAMQELTFSEEGEIKDSRIATAANEGFFQPLSTRTGPRVAGASDVTFAIPTSLSYSHPYLVCSHADNTLTQYLVTSSPSALSISPGKRLWGHASAVFSAHVSNRGRAVSVTKCGEEVRLWELEGSTLTSASDARRKRHPEMSVQVASGQNAAPFDLKKALSETPSTTRGWVGFDEEKAVVLREGEHGKQMLVVYDFT